MSMPRKKQDKDEKPEVQGLSRIRVTDGLFGVPGGRAPERAAVPQVRSERLDVATGTLVCDQCEGMGFTFTTDARGNRLAHECPCRAALAEEKAMLRSGIPPRFKGASFDNYVPQHASQSLALVKARGWADQWPLRVTDGLALSGPVGVGKTHLAIATMRSVQNRGGRCIFVNMPQFLEQIKETYGGNSVQTGAEVLRPVFEADLVILDEMGKKKPTDWDFDTTAQIVNTRYDAGRAVIITTNLAFRPAAGAKVQPSTGYGESLANAMRVETLGERLGAPTFSRIREMCGTIEMAGEDFRARAK